MSQLPGGDVSSSESSEEENIKEQDAKNGLDLVSPLTSEANPNSIKNGSINSKASGQQTNLAPSKAEGTANFSKETFEVVSSITDINFEHISCMQVHENNRLVLGGRWFGIYNCELDSSDNTIVTKKKLVDECKHNH